MDTIAFGLRADFLPDGPTPFVGGLIRLGPDGRELDLAQALADGGGVIVITADDETAAEALGALDVLKEVPSPSAPEALVTRYDGLTSAGLSDALELRDLPVGGTKAAKLQRLLNADRAIADGVQPAARETGDAGVAGTPDEQSLNLDAGDDADADRDLDQAADHDDATGGDAA